MILNKLKFQPLLISGLFVLSIIFMAISPSAGTLAIDNEKKKFSRIMEWYQPPSGYSDGYDEVTLEWANIEEARSVFRKYYTILPQVGIAVLDNGIDPDVWQWIESQGGDIVRYIRPQQTWQWVGGLIGWLPTGWEIYSTTSSSKASSTSSHGGSCLSVAWQIAQTAKFYVFHIDYTRYGQPADITKAWELSLKWIINHPEANIKVITQSLKTTTSGSGNPTINYYIQQLHNDGVIYFTSGGNSGAYCNRWPDKLDKVHAVGAHYHHGTLTGKICYYSSYGPNIDFTAPIDDGNEYGQEVVCYCYKGDQSGTSDADLTRSDGTSLASPFIAGVAAVIYAAYGYQNRQYFGGGIYYYPLPDADYVFDILKECSEQKTSWRHRNNDWEYYSLSTVPKPILNGWVETGPHVRNDDSGWGVPDLYDAIKIIRGDLTPPTLID